MSKLSCRHVASHIFPHVMHRSCRVGHACNVLSQHDTPTTNFVLRLHPSRRVSHSAFDTRSIFCRVKVQLHCTHAWSGGACSGALVCATLNFTNQHDVKLPDMTCLTCAHHAVETIKAERKKVARRDSAWKSAAEES